MQGQPNFHHVCVRGRSIVHSFHSYRIATHRLLIIAVSPVATLTPHSSLARLRPPEPFSGTERWRFTAARFIGADSHMQPHEGGLRAYQNGRRCEEEGPAAASNCKCRPSSRPDSADGFLSPLLGSGNGEKDWENGSTTSSVASNTEYTGPKLYKEPSAKSNKHIIQNALAHCCLAGKVNEGQKNRILEEIDKSEANNFLVLFRDSGCQFRSLYTYYPETEEITKLAGIGPKSITRKMIESLYKYNSDRKQFSHIPAKTMSASVDAITIYSHLWQIKKTGTPKKALTLKS
ncbi:hypothetical protein SKAU_G00200040 [Synaphobranchus kaupii]|uniref:CKK domain-containing protein n=1 Tax=Synaphobranchus kaupii TaxID=118154 RepID=A0A9Q1FF94_SYNKA|nr:hypothetical protein SKAU_G00200040 [Synaphobranchus kaupii]